MPLARIRRLLADGGAQRLSPDQPVWELDSRAGGRWWRPLRRARRFHALQLEILEAAASLPAALHLVVDDDPQDYDVGGTWSHAHDRTYRIPEDCRLDTLNERVLEPGDWTIYAAHEALDPGAIPDAFQVDADQLALFSRAHELPLVVQAFHDNDPWRVWVEAVRAPHEAAA